MVYEEMEDLEIFRLAERICDRIYELVTVWNEFDKHTIGSQLVRAADSIGANIAESYGRYHFGEQIQFLYYGRGSIYESKFWLRRAAKRNLLQTEVTEKALALLDELAAKRNAYIRSKRNQRNNAKGSSNTLRESTAPYELNDDAAHPFGVDSS